MVPPFLLRVTCHLITEHAKAAPGLTFRKLRVSKSLAAAQILDHRKTVAF